METKNEIIRKLKKAFEGVAELALLFGSASKDRLKPESDIDVGVFMQKLPESEEERLNFKLDLAKSFDRDIDIIFLNDCDPIIAMQILSNGELILNKNPR